VLAAAALQGDTEPDLLDEVSWWQTDDFWQYALFAAVAYIRAAASRTGVPVRQACQDLAQRPGTQRHNDHFGTRWKRSNLMVGRPIITAGAVDSLAVLPVPGEWRGVSAIGPVRRLSAVGRGS
jgi:hypothetical protein